jgi:hypothetical protein
LPKRIRLRRPSGEMLALQAGAAADTAGQYSAAIWNGQVRRRLV